LSFVIYFLAARAGFEPASRRSKRPILPLEDPAGIKYKSQKTNHKQARNSKSRKLTADSSSSCGSRNRTCVRAINSRLPGPALAPPQSVGVQRVLQLSTVSHRQIKNPVPQVTPGFAKRTHEKPDVTSAGVAATEDSPVGRNPRDIAADRGVDSRLDCET